MSRQIRTEYNASSNTIEVVVPANYSMEELFTAINSSIAELSPEKSFNILVDAMASESDRELAEIREFIKRGAHYSNRVIRVAIMVNRLLHFGLSNQAATYAAMEGFSVKPFWNRSSADKWLQQAGDFSKEYDAWDGGKHVG
ncbi:MAG: hypothetical protein MRY76_11445 [Pseudomonadales bacterium]|nr:hypothetical protein [Pseudomonadales bacterium]